MPPLPDLPAGGVRVDVRVPAKINLFLAVRGRRDDSYHELVSVMQSVSLKDRVVASMDDAAYLHPAMRRMLRVDFTHDGTAGIPDGAENLVVRAAHALLRRLGGTENGDAGDDQAGVTRLHLNKQIPVAAGMGGGSADAAAALVALNSLWDGGLELEELRDLAKELGSDVPFCVAGGTALTTGTGTATAQVLSRGAFHWVIGMSATPLPTPEVYDVFDDVSAPSGIEPDVVLQALRIGDPGVLGAALHNDLEAAAFHLRPGLREARDAMLESGAMGAIVSGAGPTLIALARDRVAAARVQAAVSGRFDRCQIATSPCGGPAFG